MDDRRRGQRGPETPAEPSGNLPAVELQDFLDHVNRGALIEGGSTSTCSCTAQRRTRCGSSPRSTPDTARPRKCELLADLTGKPVDDSVVVFPPFYSELART